MRTRPAARGARGSILMIVVILLALLAVIPIGMQMVSTSRQTTETQLKMVGQADNFARAGLMDAVNWFRRQTSQPVNSSSNPALYTYPDAAFAPQVSTNTSQSDTIDASIGIVQEYLIDANSSLYGRYEVSQQKDTATNPVDSHAVHDITNLRVPGQSAGAGLAWYIESKGIVYRKMNPNVAYNVAPNQVMGTARIATEIRRVSLIPPVEAAVIVNKYGSVDSFTSNSRIVGGSNVGVGYYTKSGSPTITTGSGVTGTPATSSIAGSLNPTSVFGVDSHDLGLMADYSVTSMASLPASYPSQAIVLINGNADFNASHPLIGGGILYVTGTLLIESTASTFFSGVIYAAGNVTIDGPATIAGLVMTSGNLTLNGSGDVVTIQNSASIITAVQQEVACYRESRSEYYTFTAIK